MNLKLKHYYMVAFAMFGMTLGAGLCSGWVIDPPSDPPKEFYYAGTHHVDSDTYYFLGLPTAFMYIEFDHKVYLYRYLDDAEDDWDVWINNYYNIHGHVGNGVTGTPSFDRKGEDASGDPYIRVIMAGSYAGESHTIYWQSIYDWVWDSQDLEIVGSWEEGSYTP